MTRRRPGDRLRALASRCCSDAAMERLVDPAIADLQCEYADAVRRGQVWRRCVVRAAGTFAFWKVIGLYAASRAVANHAFGELAFGRHIPRGTYEMTLSELWATGRWLDAHQRLALSLGPAILGLFAFSVSAGVKHRSRALVLGLVGIMAYAAQWVILPAPVPALAQSVPAILAAWTPNLIIAAATAAILKSSHS